MNRAGRKVPVTREQVECGSLNGIFGASRAALTAIHGMGDSKYAQLQAVFELSRRAASEQLREALLLGFILAALQQRRTLFAQQMDTGEFEQGQQHFGRRRLGPRRGGGQQQQG